MPSTSRPRGAQHADGPQARLGRAAPEGPTPGVVRVSRAVSRLSAGYPDTHACRTCATPGCDAVRRTAAASVVDRGDRALPAVHRRRGAPGRGIAAARARVPGCAYSSVDRVLRPELDFPRPDPRYGGPAGGRGERGRTAPPPAGRTAADGRRPRRWRRGAARRRPRGGGGAAPRDRARASSKTVSRASAMVGTHPTTQGGT